MCDVQGSASDFEAQIKCALAGQRSHPDFHEFPAHLGFAYEALQQYDKAIKGYTQAIELGGQPFLSRRAACYAELHQRERAEQDIRETERRRRKRTEEVMTGGLW